mmetsp:Transcript_31994/g.51668  ORF Transcript_31994/g.51668 Transcript_31994/m.51668 type:complete len:1406 (-) Transcript_31994:604-4821(-)
MDEARKTTLSTPENGTNRRSFLIVRSILGWRLKPSSILCRKREQLAWVIALYYTFMVPFRIAFVEQNVGWTQLLPDFIVDAISLAVYTSRLFTAYLNRRGALETSLTKILMHYLKTEFVSDAVAALPLDVLSLASGSQVNTAVWFRIAKLVKGMLIIKYISRVDEGGTIDQTYEGVKRVVLLTMLVGHWTACIWYYISWAFRQDGHSWQNSIINDPFAKALNFGENAYHSVEYLVSFWWSTGVISGVGAGNITPQNDYEIIWSIFTMVMNLTFYSYTTMALSAFFSNQDQDIVHSRKEWLELLAYIRKKTVHPSIARELQSYLDFRAAKKMSDTNMFRQLPHSLQLEVARHSYRTILQDCTILAGCDEAFLDALAVLLQEVTLMPNSSVVRQNEFGRELFIVSEGLIEVLRPAMEAGSSAVHMGGGGENDVVRIASRGDVIGELAFFFGVRQPYGARVSASAHAVVYIIPKQEYADLCKAYPQQDELILRNAFQSCGWETGRSVQSATARSNSTSTLLQVIAQAREKKEQEKIAALCSAASKNNLEEVKRLLLSSDLNVNAGDYDGRTALHLAASEGHVELVRFLLERKANINVVDRYGGTPLDDAVRHARDEVATLLLNFNGRMQTENVPDKVINASAAGDLDTLRRLIRFGVDPNQVDYDRRTPLHLAAANGHLQLVKFLVSQRVDLNAVDRKNGTALQDALRHNHHHIAKYLRRHGAQLILSDTAGALCWAAAAADVSTMRILLEGGVPIESADYDGRTSLHVAAAEGHLAATEYLLHAGAPVTAVDRWHGTPLHDAIRHSHNLIAQLLRAHGCEINTEGVEPTELEELQRQERDLANGNVAPVCSSCTVSTPTPTTQLAVTLTTVSTPGATNRTASMKRTASFKTASMSMFGRRRSLTLNTSARKSGSDSAKGKESQSESSEEDQSPANGKQAKDKDGGDGHQNWEYVSRKSLSRAEHVRHNRELTFDKLVSEISALLDGNMERLGAIQRRKGLQGGEEEGSDGSGQETDGTDKDGKGGVEDEATMRWKRRIAGALARPGKIVKDAPPPHNVDQDNDEEGGHRHRHGQGSSGSSSSDRDSNLDETDFHNQVESEDEGNEDEEAEAVQEVTEADCIAESDTLQHKPQQHHHPPPRTHPPSSAASSSASILPTNPTQQGLASIIQTLTPILKTTGSSRRSSIHLPTSESPSSAPLPGQLDASPHRIPKVLIALPSMSHEPTSSSSQLLVSASLTPQHLSLSVSAPSTPSSRSPSNISPTIVTSFPTPIRSDIQIEPLHEPLFPSDDFPIAPLVTPTLPGIVPPSSFRSAAAVVESSKSLIHRAIQFDDLCAEVEKAVDGLPESGTISGGGESSLAKAPDVVLVGSRTLGGLGTVGKKYSSLSEICLPGMPMDGALESGSGNED